MAQQQTVAARLAPTPGLTTTDIFRTWWPLAISWVFMAAEGPALAAVIARLAQPAINLAAWGGIIYPLALIIEAPIIMLLPASTALSKDLASYHKLRRFMVTAGASLTLLHILVVLTPLYDFITRQLIGAPPAILEPGRQGFIIMIPWTWAIAYRRFNQGVLIRCGHSRTVGLGTAVRLLADGVVLGVGYALGLPGAVVASAAIIAGVLSEAAYVSLVVRPVIRNELSLLPAVDPPLHRRPFLAFYVPLVLTSLLSFLAPPMGSAALSRMPQALASLAVWPVVTGLVFILRGLGVGFNEVVVALLERPAAAASLRRFAWQLAAITSAALLLIVATPLAGWWFGSVAALSPELAALASAGLWLALPMPALAALQSWLQGTILYSRRTRGISEAVVVYLITTTVILAAGVVWGQITGLYAGLAAVTVSTLAQTLWLWARARPVLQRNAELE